ncbi:MAG: c-type cytochrome [Desulfobaccales bacterium]
MLTWGALIAALCYIAAIIPAWAARAPGAPPGQRVVEGAGEELAGRLGCFACHKKGPGRLAPSLDGVGSRLTREQLQVVLVQSRRLHPGAKMPSYAYLPGGERLALLDFLESLK